jgi:hypothetical protein
MGGGSKISRKTKAQKENNKALVNITIIKKEAYNEIKEA